MSYCKHLLVVLGLATVVGCAGKDASPGDEPVGLANQADTASRPSVVEPIDFGEVVSATLTPRDKFHAFTFTAKQGQPLDIYVDGLRGLDTVIDLYRVSMQTGRPVGASLASNDDTTSPGWMLRTNTTPNELSSSLNITAPSSGTFALVVTTYRQKGRGTAEIVVKTPQADYRKVTLAELEATPDAFGGERLEVVAEPHAGPAACTKMGCSEANPCCNRCSSGFRIGETIALDGESEGTAFGCSGDSCDPVKTCTPFAAGRAGFYTFRGTFVTDDGQRTLKVDTYERSTCQRGGCSGQLCVQEGAGGGISTCIYLPRFACYQDASAVCRPAGDGTCGWEPTSKLQSCLASNP